MLKAITLRPEKRTDTRFPTAIPSRLVTLHDNVNIQCVVTDLSASGAGIHFSDVSISNERVCKLNISWFGAFEGITTRSGNTSAGVRFLVGEAERNNLRAMLARFVETGISPLKEAIRSENPMLPLTLLSGERYFCAVLNISLRGVLLNTTIRMPPGELVKVGSLYGRVGHHLGEGLAITFVISVQSAERSASQHIATLNALA